MNQQKGTSRLLTTICQQVDKKQLHGELNESKEITIEISRSFWFFHLLTLEKTLYMG